MRRFLFILLLLVAIGGLIVITHPVSTLGKPPASTQSIDVYFSPKGDIQKRIIKEIDEAKSSIDIAIYSFTSKKVADALMKAKKRGVSIRLIMDSEQANKDYSQYDYFDKNDFDVKLKGKKGRSSMHNKVCIFDGKLLMTGSYNISKRAELYNYENVVFISDKSVVKKYQEMFEKLWEK